MFTVFTLGSAVVLMGAGLAYLLTTSKGRRSLLLAMRSLWLHKMRAFLSVLGIIIGTGAVIALMAFGEGSKQDALADIARLGATNIMVRSVKPPDDANSQKRSFVANYGLSRQDYENFELIPTVTRMVPMRIAYPQEVRRLEKMVIGRIVATTPAYQDVNQLHMAAGRFLVEKDDAQMENVCVLGWEMAQRLFPYEEPVGDSIRLGGHFYRVVGVCQHRMPTGGAGGSQAAEEFDLDVYIPLQTSRVRMGDTIIVRQSGSRSGEKVYLHQVTLTVKDMDSVRPTGDLIRQMLSSHLKQDWALTVPLDKLEEAERTKSRFNQLMVMIGSISLFVGGIGIMNIMLATVTERTREIGIRRALGAKRRDITLQFLVEAMVQTSVGGLLGTVLGLALAFGLPLLANSIPEDWAVALIGTAHLPVKVHLEAIFWAIFFAVLVGIGFGLYPAYRAAHMDPIEALRHV
jgi:putative ABC transport system permease protein